MSDVSVTLWKDHATKLSQSSPNWIHEMAIQLHKTVQAFRAFRRTLTHGKSVGFVPTMGALHDGESVSDNYIMKGIEMKVMRMCSSIIITVPIHPN